MWFSIADQLRFGASLPVDEKLEREDCLSFTSIVACQTARNPSQAFSSHIREKEISILITTDESGSGKT